jgi:hypothetical protein
MRQPAVECVPHEVALLAHVDDGDAVKLSDVVRLPAARRIEPGLVERDARTLRVDRNDDGVELLQVGVA